MRFAALLPMALAMVAFICSMLCLFAGYKPGFMEDYSIITLNTSRLGYDLLANAVPEGGVIPDDTVLPDFLDDILNKGEDELTETANEIANKIADRIADELGINEWYSLHVMDLCYGGFNPNATAPGASKNGTNCTRDVAMNNFDITTLLERELAEGPLKLNLSDIQWPPEIQDGLDKLNTALDASFILYCIGIAAAGLSIITSLIAVFLNGSRLFSIANGLLAFLAFLCLLITSVIVTIVQNKATGILNEHGNEIGLFAYKGTKFLILSWVSVAAMFVSFVTWVGLFCVGRKNKKREYTEKRGGGSRGGFGGWRHRRSDEHALRRSGV